MLNIEAKKRMTIFVSFDSFLQELSLIRTKVLDSLIQKGYHLVIIVNNDAQKKHIDGYFLKKDVDVVKFDDKFKLGFIDNVIMSLFFLKYIKKMPPNRKALIEAAARNKNGFLAKLKRRIVIFVSYLPEKFLLWIQYNIFSKKELDLLFLKYRPILTIFSWAGIHHPGRLLVRSAKKYKCKTISIDACWDLMEDATWAPILDKLLVWNEEMKREAIQYHGYPSERVEVVGILRCDFYRRKDILLSREGFFKKYSLDKNRKLITFILNSACPIPLSLEILKIIRHSQNIIYPIQIFVRLDPYMTTECLDEFLNDPLVRIDRGFSQEQLISESDVISLVNLLAHSDIVISILSTLILESCYFDKPNISIAFEPIRNLYNRDFIQPLILQNGLRIVYNENDLINSLNAYLLNPKLESEGRKKILRNLCFGGDGKAVERTLLEIEKLLQTKEVNKTLDITIS